MPTNSGGTQNRPDAFFSVPVVVQPPPAMAKFDEWTDRYLAASVGPKRDGLVAEGVALAQSRRPEMKQLIEADPGQALLLAVPPKVRAALPAAILPEIEREISGEGFLGVLAICGPDTDAGAQAAVDSAAPLDRIEREVWIGGEQFRAHVSRPELAMLTQEDASINGVAIDNELALRQEKIVLVPPEDVPNIDSTTPGVAGIYKGAWYWFEDMDQLAAFEKSLEVQPSEFPTAASGPTLDPASPPPQPSPPTIAYNAYDGPYSWQRGPKTVMVYLVRPSDAPAWTNPPDYNTLNSQLDESSRAYFQASYGKTWFGPKYVYPGQANELLIPRLVVTQVLNLPKTAAEYTANFGQLYFDCVAAAQAQGGTFATDQIHDPSKYDRQVVMSNVKMIGSTGLAFLGGRFAWLGNSLNGSVALHEWGHNWGVHHANYWVGNNGLPRNPQGTTTEYGDGADIMGGGGTMFNALFKQNLGFLDENQGDLVQVTASGTYRLFNHTDPYGDTETSRVRGLIIPGSNWTSNRIVLGYRHEAGVEGGPSRNDWDRGAVQLHTLMPSGPQSQYLDITPGSNADDDRTDGSLKVGRTYSEVASLNPTQIFGGVHITPVGSGTTSAGGRSHSWIDVAVNYGGASPNAPTGSIATSNGMPSVGQPVTLTVSASDADGNPLAYDWDFGDGKLSITNSNVQTKSWSTPGFYRVNCTVSDMTGRSTVVSAWINVGNLPYRTPEDPAATMPGLAYRYYEGSFPTMPDFSKLFPLQSGTVTTFSISNRLVNDGFSYLYEGYLDVPVSDVYTFHLDSDDGSRLYIGNSLVVDGNALRSSSEEAKGNIALSAGRHAIRVEFFHQGGAEDLLVSWSTISSGKQPIPSSALSQIDWGGNVVPIAAVSAPIDGSIYPSGASVTLLTNASDTNGIAAVRYFEGQNFIGESSTGPNFGFTWQNVSSGVHTVRAVAYDATGRWTISNTISFELRAPEAANVISVNFTGNSSDVVTSGEKAGAVQFVKGWNNLVGSIGSLSNLKDQTDTATSAVISTDLSQSFTTTGGTPDGNGRLMRNGFWDRDGGNGRVSVNAIPYPEYDVYVYLDAPLNPFDSVEDITLGSYTLNGITRYARNSLVHGDALGDYPTYDTWTGMKEAAATTTSAPAGESLGNYIVFRGVTDPTLTLDVQQKRAVNGIQIVQVPVSSPRVILRQSVGSTVVTEGGEVDSYTVELSVAPTANVTVTIIPDGQVTASAGTLTFTPSNWNLPQTVTLTAVDDALNESSPHAATINHAVGGSGIYGAISDRQIAVSVTDNDRPTVSVYPIGRATEGGANGTLRFVRAATLAAGGSQTVSFAALGGSGLSLTSDITLSGGSATINTGAGTGTVTFPSNATTVDVTVMANDDAVVESFESLTVTVTASPGYNLGSSTVAVLKVHDNDSINRWTQYFVNSGSEPTSFEANFDCNNKKITFTPDGSSSIYSASMISASSFSSSTTGHQQLVTATSYYYSAPYQVSYPSKFFGTTYSTLWISPNGSICMENPGSLSVAPNKYYPSLSTHFTVKRISALFSTGFSAVNGTTTIYVGRIASVTGQERTVVTYNNLVYNGNINNKCSAQVELFDSGVITISWLNGTTPTGVLVGLSDGSGLPSPFAQTNLSDISFGSGNTAPVFASLPLILATQGQTWTYEIRTSEPDGTPSTITAPNKPAWLTLTDVGDGTAILTGIPPASGSFPVVVQVADAALSTSQSFTLTVVPPGGNTLPVFTSSPPLAGTSGDELSYTLGATDADGHTLTFTRANLPGWLTLTPTGGGTALLTGTIPAGLPISFDLAVSVGDGVSVTTQSWRMTLNSRPQIQMLRPTAARPWLSSTDARLVLDARVTDDGLPTNTFTTTWSTVSGPGEVVFDDSAAASTLASFPMPGVYLIRLSADDGSGPTTHDFPVYIGTSPIAPLGVNGEYYNGTAFAGVPAVKRIDSTIDFGFGSGTGPAPAVGSNISVRWTGWIIPQYSEDYLIIPNVDDGARVWVNGVKVVDEWSGGPPRDLTATPIALQANVPAKVVMEYYNGGNGSAKLQWQSPSRSKQTIPAASWRSEDPNYNRAPILESLSDQDGVAGAAVTLTPSASDDGLPLVPGLVGYAWSQISGSALGSFSDSTSPITTFTSPSVGSYLLRLQADDGEIRVAREFTLNLIAPSLSFGSWMAGYSGLSGDDALTSADPDGDGLSNFLEYAFSLDPTLANAANAPAVTMVEGSGDETGNQYLTITYRQRSGGTGTIGVDYTAAGVIYGVEVSDTLSPLSWNAGTAWVEAVGLPADNGDGTQTVIVRRKLPLGDTPKSFIRLRAISSQ